MMGGPSAGCQLLSAGCTILAINGVNLTDQMEAQEKMQMLKNAPRPLQLRMRQKVNASVQRAKAKLRASVLLKVRGHVLPVPSLRLPPYCCDTCCGIRLPPHLLPAPSSARLPEGWLERAASA